MTEPQDPKTMPKANLRKPGFQWIWLVPIVALLVVCWLGWQHFANQGPEIKISFQRADGLEAGRTPIKHKAVTVGVVKSIELSKDLSHVIVTANMDRNMKDFLGPDTKLWVVRPRFNSGNISGLDTLVSGAYISIQPVNGDEQDTFTALENPPVSLSDVPGRHYVLHTDRLAALDDGSAIYYRGIEVGAVMGYQLRPDAKGIDVYIFVRDPYAQYVTPSTRFWNASGVDINTSVNGFQVQTESLRALLSGGIAFDTSPQALGHPAPPDSQFQLYENEKTSDADPAGPHYYYIVDFPGQVQNLAVRSWVDIQGVRVGRVVDISQHIDAASGEVFTPVTIEIEEDNFHIANAGGKSGEAAMTHALDALVRKGYRATLASASLLTGQRFIEISPHPEASPARLETGGAHPHIPAVDSGTLEDAEAAATVLLKHADKLVGNLSALTGPDQLQTTVKSLNDTVKDLGHTLNTLDTSIRPLGKQLPGALGELKDAARSVKGLAGYLQENPQSLVFGRNDAAAPAEPVPAPTPASSEDSQ